MDKLAKETLKQKLRFPAVLALLAAFLMLLTVFLPFLTATEELAAYIEANPNEIAIEDADVTAQDMATISMAEYGKIYYAMRDQYWDPIEGTICAILVCVIMGSVIITALFAWGRKPIGCMLFGALAYGAYRLLEFDAVSRGIVPDESYNWGITHTMFPIAAAFLGAIALWMLVQKIIVKKQIKAHAKAESPTENSAPI